MEGGKGRVCVTGGTGFIASVIIKRLLHEGYSVNTTIRSSPEFHFLETISSTTYTSRENDKTAPDEFKIRQRCPQPLGNIKKSPTVLKSGHVASSVEPAYEDVTDWSYVSINGACVAKRDDRVAQGWKRRSRTTSL
ncbi:hypothetical protein PIB30_070425 [Stylosanthes scabra]|uniref:NAD-dependent epimerase/dehydratase domain-containing protein n=1 Tax=Stylosanthes scabra TaxID=79078 RepID=A0ABU6QP52_9FABA|nr:hypothetical protein [Stylosanthes scabra]